MEPMLTKVDVLIVLDLPSPDLAAESRRRLSGRVKVLYWAQGSLDPTILLIWADHATQIVAQDSLVGIVGDLLGREPEPLSRFAILRNADCLRAAADTVPGPNSGHPVLFFPTTDIIAKMFLKIAEHCQNAVYAAPVKWKEGAVERLRESGTAFVMNHARLLDEIAPSVVVFGNDWSDEEMDLIAAARSRGIPTACIQEGCLDWSGPFERMQWCDYPFVQGALTLNYLNRESYFGTGNPRFDSLTAVPLPAHPMVMINSNFTYGVCEDEREPWIEAVTSACRQLGVEYFICQHPRDTGTFPGHPSRRSGPDLIHGYLEECSVLVTRFSTIVYEAMLLDRAVIYFNPHSEEMATFNEDRTGALLKANDQPTLLTALSAALANEESTRAARRGFLRLHCGSLDGRAAERCATALSLLGTYGQPALDARKRRSAMQLFLRRAINRVAGTRLLIR